MAAIAVTALFMNAQSIKLVFDRFCVMNATPLPELCPPESSLLISILKNIHLTNIMLNYVELNWSFL